MAGTVICDYINSANVSGGFFGVGQTWQDVTASRSASVTYTNTTGKPIMINIRAVTGSNIGYITVDGVNTEVFTTMAANACSSIVPNGKTYVISSNIAAIYQWFELR
jgi:hypothetical protein